MKRSKHPASSDQPTPSAQEAALTKILRYCAYQERCHREVKNRLVGYGLQYNEADELLAHLITEGFLNEERYARSFAGGKFRMMKWGRIKIQHELKKAGLTPRCIAIGLAEIDPSDYLKTMKTLIRKKKMQSENENLMKAKKGVAQFVIGKGYEPELVWEAVNDWVE